jgi:hypothetical protein
MAHLTNYVTIPPFASRNSTFALNRFVFHSYFSEFIYIHTKFRESLSNLARPHTHTQHRGHINLLPSSRNVKVKVKLSR